MSLRIRKDISQYLGCVFSSQREDFMILETKLFRGKKGWRGNPRLQKLSSLTNFCDYSKLITCFPD